MIKVSSPSQFMNTSINPSFYFQATLALVVLLASKATQLWISSRMLLSIHARVAISSSSTEDRLMGPCESNFCILSLESKKFKVCSICAGKLIIFSSEKNPSIFCLFKIRDTQTRSTGSRGSTPCAKTYQRLFENAKLLLRKHYRRRRRRS